MNLQGIIIIAVGLSMISFSMAFLSSFFKCQDLPGTLKISFFQAAFQAAMYTLGWLLSLSFKAWLSQMAWPLVIFILVLLGLKMLLVSRKAKPAEKAFDLSQFRILIGVSLAASINTFIIGLAMGLINVDLIPAMPIIALASFVLSILGVILGKVSGNVKYSQLAEAIGGFLIIFIGIMLMVQYINLI